MWPLPLPSLQRDLSSWCLDGFWWIPYLQWPPLISGPYTGRLEDLLLDSFWAAKAAGSAAVALHGGAALSSRPTVTYLPAWGLMGLRRYTFVAGLRSLLVVSLTSLTMICAKPK